MTNKKELNKITALYLRLSKDDDLITGDNSNSIKNQQDMLLDYAKINEFKNIQLFIDDGYSGMIFDRPSFTKMISLVENGKVDTIIVKDLSRLGREYIKMGMFLEIIFPKNNTRFIAINDNVDSSKGYDEFLALRSLFNEFHVRETSKKVKAVKDMQAKSGERLNSEPPYGYIYNKQLKILEVHEEQSKVIKYIFELCVRDGKGPYQIAKILTEENILNPASSQSTKGKQIKYGNSVNSYWNHITVARILEMREYLGHTVTKIL